MWGEGESRTGVVVCYLTAKPRLRVAPTLFTISGEERRSSVFQTTSFFLRVKDETSVGQRIIKRVWGEDGAGGRGCA